MRASKLVLRLAWLNFCLLLLSAALNAVGPWIHL
jgi:hypothetical protein